MSERDQSPITIALSPTQVDAVVRAASDDGAPSIANIIAGSLARARDGGNGAAAHELGPDPFSREIDDPRLSRSLLRGFSLLTGFSRTAASAASSSWPMTSA